MFKQRSLREFQNEHKATQQQNQPEPSNNREKHLKPHRAQQQQHKKPKERFSQPRLPHNSRFEMRYDGVAMKWKGELAVPASGNDVFAKLFTAEANTLYSLASALDRQYRAWVKQRSNVAESKKT